MTHAPATDHVLAALPTAGRRRIDIEGIVQGVGFRPFVYNLAAAHGLGGWAANEGDRVIVEVEGPGKDIDAFVDQLTRLPPPLARIDTVRQHSMIATGSTCFEIAESRTSSEPPLIVPPDVATCRACLAEIRDPTNRRYRYPFTNCTDCGPRFSIIRQLPYDRCNTTMAGFAMCPDCAGEYTDPGDRRYHAQPNACPTCGPRLTFLDETGVERADRDDALAQAIWALRSGRIVAVKGLGGFHLMVDARDSDAVARLRQRKNRPAKPLALMMPSVEHVERFCMVSTTEREALTSIASPIVLLRRSMTDKAEPVSDLVAPDQPSLGVMLPATPLHRLIEDALGFPIVATSGNRSGEPMAIDRCQALARLDGIADCFLDHDRPIARPIDDSVVREIAGRITQFRRARGYAPIPLKLTGRLPEVTALGGQMKAAPAAIRGDRMIVWPHIGELEHPEARRAYESGLKAFVATYDLDPSAIAHDRHPDYHTSHLALDVGPPALAVQHHVAHVASCMVDNRLNGPILGVAWDGTGWGDDGTVWGGEFFRVDDWQAKRVAHLLPFPLPGGDSAVREPRRSAAGLLQTLFGSSWQDRVDLAPVASLSNKDRRLLNRMIERDLNTPSTSSMGRLFDGAASLLGLNHRCSFEGEAAMTLEAVIDAPASLPSYSIDLTSYSSDGPLQLDWRPMLAEIIADLTDSVPVPEIAARFHGALADAIVAVASRIGERHVALTGGCFQNRYLTELTVDKLRASGFVALIHRDVPPNDGGLAVGQAVWAAHQQVQEGA